MFVEDREFRAGDPCPLGSGRIFYQYLNRKGKIKEIWRTPESYLNSVASKARYRDNNRKLVLCQQAASRIRHPERWKREKRNRTIKNMGCPINKIKKNMRGWWFKKYSDYMVHSDPTRRRYHQLYLQARAIENYTGMVIHIDHIIPISKGGSHEADNLQILTQYWNCWKKDKVGVEVPEVYISPDI